MSEAPRPDPTQACLKCKAPRAAKPGQLYEGEGSNGMFVRFFLCDECAKAFAPLPRVRPGKA